MQLKQERRFLVRIIDMKSGKSRNISVYGESNMDKLYNMIYGKLKESSGR